MLNANVLNRSESTPSWDVAAAVRMTQWMTYVFGTTAIVVGIWRHLQTGDSPQAIWFGVVLGVAAIVGGLLLSLPWRVFGYVLIVFSLSVVSWWFVRRMITGHPDGLSPRVILILAMCVLEFVALMLPPWAKWRRHSTP